ncbi:hypothetical protein F4810DRAFT_190345 [Camillea tinctor]|nr:hypothetical protein F4810DRAFT_190345 [Camillea tinctor]
MDVNEPAEIVHELESTIWVRKVNHARSTGNLCRWVSNFHPHRLDCHLVGGFLYGAYNLGQKVKFNDGTSWLVRFPRVGNVCIKYVDEKVAMEVEVLHLVRDKTTIPVPGVKAWGSAALNPLGLGPFIIMDFIEGLSLNALLKDPTTPNTRLMRSDIRDSDIEFIYKQMANFLLQLFHIDFENIGSVPTTKTGFGGQLRPLTYKVHDIMQTGGVDSFGDRSQGFQTTTEYFQYILTQDWKQLSEQSNSIVGEYDARAKYACLRTLQSLLPEFVNKKYERGPFKLICDDLGLANLIVRSPDDLTIVGVVDLEWSYIGPAQLYGSPWWLLQVRLNNWDTIYDLDAPQIVERFSRHLKIFKRVLEEEERKLPGNQRELSELVTWSENSGAMWLHMLLSCGFNYADNLPFSQLRQHIGCGKWNQYKELFYGTQSMESFMKMKLAQLRQYDLELEKINEQLYEVQHGRMTEEEFTARHTYMACV